MKKFKVEYIGPTPYVFDTGEIVEAFELKKDPKKKWFVIPDEDGEEYAYPRRWFKILEETEIE